MPHHKWLYQPKGSPYWHYDFVVHGRRHHGSTKTASKPAARRFVDQLRAQILAGTLTARRPEMTLDHALGRWYQEVGQHLKEASNILPRAARLVAHLGKDTLLSEITMADLAGYAARRRAEAKPQTVNHDLATLRRVMRRAAKVWRVAVPEAIEWGEVMLTLPAPRKRHLTAQEEARLLAALPPDLAALVRFANVSGARLATLTGLRWDDVDDAEGLIVLRNVKSVRDGERHTIPLTAELRQILAGRRGQHPEHVFTYLCRKTTRDRKGGTREAGKRYPFSANGWRKGWKRALEAAGIRDLRFHDTRHTAATRITRAAGNLKVTQALLGHKNIATTARYAHVLLDDVRDALEAVPRNPPGKEKPAGRPGRLSVCAFTKNQENPDDRSQAPKAGALPGCATPRRALF